MEIRIVCVKAWMNSSGSKDCVCESLTGIQFVGHRRHARVDFTVTTKKGKN